MQYGGNMAKRRRKKINKLYKITAIVIIFAIILVIVAIQVQKNMENKNDYGEIKNTSEEIVEEPEYKTPNVKIKVIDVGQGLSIYIDAGQKEFLYDCGSAAYGDKIVNEIKADVNGKLDYVVLSHSHEEHIGGYPKIAKAFEVAIRPAVTIA